MRKTFRSTLRLKFIDVTSTRHAKLILGIDKGSQRLNFVSCDRFIKSFVCYILVNLTDT